MQQAAFRKMNQVDVNFERFNTATDEPRMLELFARRLPDKYDGQISVDRLWIPRVVPLKSGECAIQFRLKISGDIPNENLILWGKFTGSVKSHSDGTHSDDSRLIEFEELGLVVPLFPYDPKLPLLETLWNSGQRQPVKIPSMSKDSHELWFTPRDILGYRLEKRCTLRGDLRIKSGAGVVQSRDVVLKLVRPRVAIGLIKNHNFLDCSGLTYDARDGITTPQLLLTDEQAGIIITETVAGPSLHDLTTPKRFVPACANAGRALRRLHSLDPSDLPTFTIADEISVLRRNSALAAKIHPDLAENLAMTIDALEANIPKIDSSGYVVSHRDFFDKQILISDNRVTLLDFDTLALADPALDVGNFLAHLYLRGLQNSELRNCLEQGSDAFTGAYFPGRNDSPESIHWWRAATLVRLAGLYSLRPRWRQIAPALLDQAVKEIESVIH